VFAVLEPNRPPPEVPDAAGCGFAVGVLVEAPSPPKRPEDGVDDGAAVPPNKDLKPGAVAELDPVAGALDVGWLPPPRLANKDDIGGVVRLFLVAQVAVN
jgi:hypothetical protein